jgi:hypothetical protein
MRTLRDKPFPFETARDLLGILRAMYAATKQQGGNERTSPPLTAMLEGRMLSMAGEATTVWPESSRS